VWRRFSLIAVLVAGVCIPTLASVEDPASAGDLLLNDTAIPAVGVRVTFSKDNVRIKWHDEDVFPAQDPEERSESFWFSGGHLPADSAFELRWVPGNASVVSVQWQPDPAVVQQAQANLEALQAKIDATLLGGTVEVPEGLYVGDLTVTNPVAILAQPGAVLVGDLVVNLGVGESDPVGDSGSESAQGSGTDSDLGEGFATSISNLTINGSITIENSEDVFLQGIAVTDSPGDGVSVINSSIAILDCSITGCAGTAIQATQGSWVGVSENSLADNAEGEFAVDAVSAVEETSSPQSLPSTLPAAQSGTGSESGSGDGFGSGSDGTNGGTSDGSGDASGSGSDGTNGGTSDGSGDASGSGSDGTNGGTSDGSGDASGSGSDGTYVEDPCAEFAIEILQPSTSFQMFHGLLMPTDPKITFRVNQDAYVELWFKNAGLGPKMIFDLGRLIAGTYCMANLIPPPPTGAIYNAPVGPAYVEIRATSLSGCTKADRQEFDVVEGVQD